MQISYEERIDEPTPEGGTYSIAYFRDKDGSPCQKDKSVAMTVVEYNSKDEPIYRTYMTEDKE
jgi:hypothetical protein